MKKLLSLFLAVIMVMAIAVMAIPTTIFAAGDTSSGATDAYFRIGDQYYSSLKSALDDAKDGDTIEMLKDYNDPSTAFLGEYAKSLTINGNGYTYTALKNSNKYMFYIKAGKTLTMNRMNMIVQSGFGICGEGGVINLNDCNITSTYRMAIRTYNAKKAEFNLHNTVLTCDSSTMVNGTAVNGSVAEPLVYIDATDYAIINMTGASKLIRRSPSTGDIGNCSVINVVSNSGYVEINVGSDSEIVIAHKTGNVNGPQGICSNGQGVFNLRLAEGAVIRVDSDIEASAYILYTKGDRGGVSVIDKGANILVKSTRTNKKPVTYLSGYETWQQVDTVVENGYTTFKYVTPVETDATKTIRYYDGSIKYTNDFKTAASAADNGTTIYFLNNFTQTSANGMLNREGERISVVGNGYTVNFNNNNAGGTFPIFFKANMAVVNFGKLSTSTGGLQGYSGSSVIADGVFESGNRAALKMSGGAGTTCELTVRNAELTISKSAPSSEAVIIFEGAGTSVFNLQENSVVRKNNPYNTGIGGQASVAYTSGSGTHTVNMASGTKIISNTTSGNAEGTIFAHTSSVKFALNMEQGAYLVSDSTVATTLHFFNIGDSSKFKLNAPADAYLIKEGMNVTVKDYNESPEYGDHTGTFAAKSTSDVAGYTQYVLTTPVNEEFFVYINSYGDEVPVTFAQALDLPGTNTVKLRADRTFSDNGKSITASRNLTIDLNGHTLNNTATNYVFSVIDGTLTIKNGTFNLKRGFVTSKSGSSPRSGELNLINVTGNSSERPYIKISSGTPVVNIQDSTITCSANGENVILVENSAAGTINVTGNSYVAHKGGSQGGTNCSVIMIAGNSSVNITVGAGATMSSAYQIKDTSWGGVVVSASNNQNTNSVLTLEAGSKLAIERVNGAGGEAYFVRKRDDVTHKIDVIDKGATYTVNEAISKDGFYLPTITLDNGETYMGGFTAGNGTIYKPGMKVKVPDATGTTTFTAMSFTDADFGMIPGASLRNTPGERGIRFSTQMTDEFKATLGNNATFGTVLVPTHMVDNANITTATADALVVASTSMMQDFNDGTTDYDNAYHVAVVMPGASGDLTKADIYGLELYARSYVTVTYSDGSTATFYTGTNARDMKTVAENLAANGATGWLIGDILNTFAAN